MRRNLYEFLKEVNDAPSKAERVRMLQAFNVKPLKTMLQLAFDKNIQLDVPEGAPPFKRDEREPIGMSSTDLMNETRRLARTAVGTTDINKVRKETIFVQILEGIHYTEADLVIACKDKKLGDMFPNVTREVVRKAFPSILTDIQTNQYTKKAEA